MATSSSSGTSTKFARSSSSSPPSPSPSPSGSSTPELRLLAFENCLASSMILSKEPERSLLTDLRYLEPRQFRSFMLINTDEYLLVADPQLASPNEDCLLDSLPVCLFNTFPTEAFPFLFSLSAASPSIVMVPSATIWNVRSTCIRTIKFK